MAPQQAISCPTGLKTIVMDTHKPSLLDSVVPFGLELNHHTLHELARRRAQELEAKAEDEKKKKDMERRTYKNALSYYINMWMFEMEVFVKNAIFTHVSTKGTLDKIDVQTPWRLNDRYQNGPFTIKNLMYKMEIDDLHFGDLGFATGETPFGRLCDKLLNRHDITVEDITCNLVSDHDQIVWLRIGVFDSWV